MSKNRGTAFQAVKSSGNPCVGCLCHPFFKGLLSRDARLRQRIGPNGRAAGRVEIGLADEVPAAGGDAKFVLAAGQVLLCAAEAAAAVVLDRAMRFANEGARCAVAQVHILTIDEKRNRQLSARLRQAEARTPAIPSRVIAPAPVATSPAAASAAPTATAAQGGTFLL